MVVYEQLSIVGVDVDLTTVPPEHKTQANQGSEYDVAIRLSRAATNDERRAIINDFDVALARGLDQLGDVRVFVKDDVLFVRNTTIEAVAAHYAGPVGQAVAAANASSRAALEAAQREAEHARQHRDHVREVAARITSW